MLGNPYPRSRLLCRRAAFTVPQESGAVYGVMTSRNPRVWKAWSGLFRTREADRQYRE